MTGQVVRPALSALRRGRITASRLPAVLGISPFTSPAGVMRQMVREHFGAPDEFTGNVATAWGHRFEEVAVAEYELTRGVPVHHSGDRQQTLVHPVFDFLAATPDGMTANRVVEAKAPWKARYTSITERPDYAAQLELQLEVTGLDRADLVIWRQGQSLIVDTVDRDMGWLGGVLPVIEEFLTEYRAVLADPELSAPHREPLRDDRTDLEWAVAAAEWLELDYLLRQLTEARDQTAATLGALSPDKPARGGGVDLLRFQRRGSVQYKQILADLNVAVDLEKYRGKPAAVTTIRRTGAHQKEGKT